MKNWPWKTIGIISFLAIALAAAIFFTNPVRATGDGRPLAVNPAFGEHITAYTSGLVSAAAPIRIELAQAAADSLAVGREAAVKLFSFSPAVAGQAVWTDVRTLEFRPAQRLASGQRYRVSFLLARLVDNLPADLRTFEFDVQVIGQSYEVEIENVRPAERTDLTKQRIEGVLTTADVAEAGAVASMLAATQNGAALAVSWTHTAQGRNHRFVVANVARGEQASRVVLALDGSRIGTDRNETQEVEIPALSDFKITQVRVEQGASQAVVIQFSDPLQNGQPLDGLIRLGEAGNLDFEIDDNLVRVFPPLRQTGTLNLTVEPGIRNVNDYPLPQGGSFDVRFEELSPAVRFAGKGNIVPSSVGMVLPFEAVNLKRVEVQVIRIYESSVLQFFQVNDWEGNSELRRVGRPVARQVISLSDAGVADIGRWNRFTLDLASLMTPEPGAIYQVRLGIRKEFSALACMSEVATEGASPQAEEPWADTGEASYWDSYEDDYYYDTGYDWEQRDNPCHASYYAGGRKVRRNVLASDLGIIAKAGEDGTTTVFVTDIKTARPLSGVQVDFYDFQLQAVGRISTDANGRGKISAKPKPFALVARNGSQRGYLRLQAGEALSVSNFDVGGEAVAQGLKGFLYGERGVWRPGDSIYFAFILEDKNNTLPAAHPVVLELANPQGQVTQRLVRTGGEHGFYAFATATAPDAPTGNWNAKVKVGGAEFSQVVRIETVKPNRLKINLRLAEEKITAARNNVRADLQVNWLHGAPGRNLKAQFEVTLAKGKTSFAKYADYTFDDITQDFSSETFPLFEGVTDEAGAAQFQISVPPTENPAPGVLNAVVRGKVFEESGNFSVDRFTVPYYPYVSYTGIRLPKGDAARGMLLTDTTHRVEVVTVDADGRPVARSGVRMKLYKISWRWWWDQSAGGQVNFMSGRYAQPVAEGAVNTLDGRGAWNFRVKYPEWGRFLIVAEDPVSGHRTSQTLYIDWPGWAGRARKEADGVTMLSFNSEKPAYRIGEKATLVIPGSDKGRALISIENGSRILQSDWLETIKGDNTYSFKVTAEMAPTVYAHVTLLQPHGQASNDMPIRMYGIIPLGVEDPATHLDPVLTMPDVLEPGQTVVLKVAEKSKRKMTYTVAMVDEGLLDLTRFKTPEPWKRFYAREALGVRTWDVYDEVMGAFGGHLERLLAVGGDAELMSKEDDAKSNRFKPVVKFLGPFTLSGGSNTHSFVMPAYVGSVKTMVVAGYEGAYGNTEKVTPVRKPLMVLATLPRVLGPGENVALPVTLFAMDKSIHSAKVSITLKGPVGANATSQEVTLTSDQQTIYFPLQVSERLGWATVEVTARSGAFTASEKINIEVRNPNPPITQVAHAIVEAGKTWQQAVDPIGMAGTNTATLEVSALPPVDLGSRLRYLYQYPYGCVEQTTSAVFPQLYVDQIKALTPAEVATVQRNVKAGIDRLKAFQNRDGSFGYWPGAESSDSWSTSYVGHFLTEAEAKGYFVPAEMLTRWKRFQRNQAQAWRRSGEEYSSEMIQAYRLYTLAAAHDPELGAMNRLREQTNLPVAAAWMLATAYVEAGQPDAARKLIERRPPEIKPYREQGYSYGSDTRDEAVILEALVALKDRERGFQLMQRLSEKLSNPNAWLSTQETAWALKAVCLFAGASERGEVNLSYSYAGKTASASTQLPMVTLPLDVEGAKSRTLKLANSGKGTLFVRVIREGTPARGNETEAASNLEIAVAYHDVDGNELNPTTLEQGQEFVASVRVTNPGLRGTYQNLAVQQIFPPGWEINNLRLDDTAMRLQADVPTWQDIRDDRVYTYFDLKPNQTKIFKVLLTASYAGGFYLPGVSCEAMYDRSIYARVNGYPVEVVSPANRKKQP